MIPLPVPFIQPAALALTGFAFGLAVLVKWLRTRRASGEVERDRRSIVGLVLQGAGMFVAALGGVDATRPLGGSLAIAGTLATLALGSAAVGLFARSAAALGANWSLVARTSDIHQLIRHGPFAYVRHPIYTAMLLLNAAVAVGLGHYALLAVALPIQLLGTAIRIRSEERLLRTRFGDEYDQYAALTPALVPRWRR